MKLEPTLRQITELGIGLTAITTLVLAGCGGGGSSGKNAANVPTYSTTTVVPYKGQFYQGSTVKIKDVNGIPAGSGTVNASGVASVTFNSNLRYPLIVEVTGSYYNEVTQAPETTATMIPTPTLRGLITSATGASIVPVTLVTETAVQDMESRIGWQRPIPASLDTIAYAVTALSAAGSYYGIPASSVPAFDPATGKSSDPNTLRLSALAVVANGLFAPGITLVDAVKGLGFKVYSNPASAPAAVINQTAYSNALVAMTSGPSSVMAAGTVPPSPSALSNSTYDTLYTAAMNAYAASAGGGGSAGVSGVAAVNSYLSDQQGSGFVGYWWFGFGVSPSGPAVSAATAVAKGLANAEAGTTTLVAAGNATYSATSLPRRLNGTGWGASPANSNGYTLTSAGWSQPSMVSTYVDNLNGTLTVTTTGLPAISYTSIARTDLSGLPIVCNDYLTNLPGACAVPGNYPAGAASYASNVTFAANDFSLSVSTYSAKGTFIANAPVTDVSGVALAALPALGTSFCDPIGLSVFQAITPAPAAGADNYRVYSTANCAATAIAAATATPATGTVLLSNMATGNTNAPTVMHVTAAATQPTTLLQDSIFGLLPSGVYSGKMTLAGQIQIWNDLNKTAINAELQASGLKPLP